MVSLLPTIYILRRWQATNTVVFRPKEELSRGHTKDRHAFAPTGNTEVYDGSSFFVSTQHSVNGAKGGFGIVFGFDIMHWKIVEL